MVQKFAVQRNADLKPCRARKMLKNAPTLAIGGADTAENEPPKVRQVSNKIRRNIGFEKQDVMRPGSICHTTLPILLEEILGQDIKKCLTRNSRSNDSKLI